MQIMFVGVGEAFDEHLPNTSILVLTDGHGKKRQILLDCGFTAAHAFWRTSPNPMALDAVWVSHFHGDHFFGLPLLMLRFWEEGRTRSLTIVGQPGVEDKVMTAMVLAYPGFSARLEFEITFVEARKEEVLHLFGVDWSFAPSRHSKPCLGLRLDSKHAAMYYSGDGRPSDDTTRLAKGVDLVVHEAFGLDPVIAGHGTVDGCIDFARTTGVGSLALVHMNRQVRKDHAADVRRRLETLEDLHAFLPEPGDIFTMGESRG